MNHSSQLPSENSSPQSFPFTADKELSQRDRVLLVQLHGHVGTDLLLWSKTGNLTSLDETFELLEVKESGIIRIQNKDRRGIILHIQDLELFGISSQEDEG